jgi:hypothetical protein
MAYFPTSQIKNNLYTNGDEFSLYPPILSLPQIPYKGYYYELANGKKYTGSSLNDGPNKLLYLLASTELDQISIPAISPTKVEILFDSSESNPLTNEYIKILNRKSRLIRNIPSYNPTSPTQKDYDLGVFQRYFCKKNNELKYIEIDKPTFQQLKSQNPQIAWDLYSAISLNWYLKGDKSKIYNTNKNLSTLIETQEKWYGFSQYFKDKYLKYYLES